MSRDPSESKAGTGRSFLDLASAVFHRPESVGEAAASGPLGGQVAAALVVIAILLVAGGVLTAPIVAREQLELMNDRDDMPESAKRAAEGFLTSRLGRAVIVVQQCVMFLVAIPLIAALLLLGQRLMGGQARFLPVLAITAFSCLISLGAGSVVRTALVLAKGSMVEVSTGLGVLVPDRGFNDPLRIALDAVDFFALWAAISAGIALAPVARLRRPQTLGVSLVVYALLMGLASSLRLLGS